MSKLPNFFIIGAPRCGTTSLAAWLAKHLNIYMSPVKEPFYFSSDIGNQWIDSWDFYLRLFERAKSEQRAIGEASTTYFFSRVAVPTIEEQIPGALYIVMLRNPVDMAYSLHDHHILALRESVMDFRQAWHLAPERRAGQHLPPRCDDPILLDYRSWCLLGEQLERLYATVPKERVRVLVLDDVKEDPRREYLRVLEFLGVPDDGRTEFPVYNPAREWRSRRAGQAIRALARAVAWSKHVRGLLPWRSLGIVRRLQELNTQHRPRPPLSPDLSTELEAFFVEDLRKLEKLLGREFPQWRSATTVAP